MNNIRKEAVSDGARGVRGWTAVLLAQLLLVVVAANGEGLSKSSVHHRVCCLKSTKTRAHSTFRSSGILVKDLAELLNRMMNNRKHDDAARNCIHNFSLGKLIRQAYEGDYNFAQGFDPTHFGNDIIVRGATSSIPRSGDKAQCVEISFRTSPSSKPLESQIDFFTSEVLDEITRRSPDIQIKEGIAELSIEAGKWNIAERSVDFYMAYDYEDAYKAPPLATEKELRTVVPRGKICREMRKQGAFSSLHSCNSAFAFIEAVTGTRAPEEDEFGLLTKDEIKNLLTLKKLKETIDIEKHLKTLKTEVDKLPDVLGVVGFDTLPILESQSAIKYVPQETLDKLRPSSSSSSKLSRSRRQQDSFDLSDFRPFKYGMICTEASRIASSESWTTPMTATLHSTQITDTFPQQGSQRRRSREKGDDSEAKESRSRSRSRKGDRELSPRQITDFLLVNSLLAVSNTKYSDFVRMGAINKLRQNMPVFTVCADKITWEPQLPPTGSSSADWLSSNYRFTITGSRHSSFGNRALFFVNPKDLSQCAVLALTGVFERGFKDLTRQPFDMIFGIFTREQIGKHWTPQEEIQSYEIESISAASGVDPWKLLSEKNSSSLTLGDLFKKVSLLIEENGFLEWPEARLSSSERGRSGRRSVSKAKSSPETQEAVKSAMQFIE